jgi:hypothetical protein
MNIRNLLIASLTGAVVSTVLSNTPYLNIVNCLLCAGFWGGAIFAVWLYKRLTGTLTLVQGVAVGALSAVFAGVMGLLLSLAGLAGLGALVNSYSMGAPVEIPPDVQPFLTGGLSWVFNLIGVLIQIVFGVIGGLIGGAIFQTRTPVPQPSNPGTP